MHILVPAPSFRRLIAALALASVIAVPTVHAQVRPTNKANWLQAERFSTENLRPYLGSTSLSPNWIQRTDEFWYTWRGSDGTHFWRVDPKAKKKTPLFDRHKMAAALSELLKKPFDHTNLPITTITFTEKAEAIRFTIERVQYEWNLKDETLKKVEAERPRTGEGEGEGQQEEQQQQQQGPPGFGGGAQNFRNFSPDRKAYVYAKDHNLFYVETEKETDVIQLTKDGEMSFSFGSRDGTGNDYAVIQRIGETQQGQGQGGQGGQNREDRVRAQASWSEDSKYFHVTRRDSREVANLFLVNSLNEPRPSLMIYKYPMPGEEKVTQTELFVFHREKKELRKYDVGKYKDQQLFNIHFTKTPGVLRFVRRDRLQRNLQLCEMALDTGAIKVLLEESVENAFLERQNVNYVKPGGDFIWFSERTGFGHFYLYDHDGKLKNAITSGPWRASQIVKVDADKDTVYLRGNGREANENPYYQHLYRVKLDGSDFMLLDPGDADHNSTLSNSNNYIVDVHSRTDMAPRAVVRNNKGEEIMLLEEVDLTELKKIGWMMPETFKVKAADGVTDIYGNMWKPFDFSPHNKYPIILNIYPGPQTESVSSTFSATAGNQRLAQLGFIVIQIGNRGGNPARSNAYHSYGYYNLRDYGLADKKAGVQQLAQRHAWIDVDKVGIFGHSGGGFMTAAALLMPPYNDFFKVGVSSAGNHDNNVYNQNWSEQHHGLRETRAQATGGTAGRAPDEPDWDALLAALNDDPQQRGTGQGRRGGAAGQGQGQGGGQGQQQGGQTQGTSETKFDIKVPTNHELAANLKGKLLLVHGDMDNNVHPAGTIRLVNALIKANKRFDMMMLPGKAHGFADMQPYFTQMMYEYFSEHLLGDYYRGTATMGGRN